MKCVSFLLGQHIIIIINKCIQRSYQTLFHWVWPRLNFTIQITKRGTYQINTIFKNWAIWRKNFFSAETEILPVRTITWPFARRKGPLGCVRNIGLDVDLERFSVMVMIAWRIWNTTENFDENCVIFSGLISLKKISEIT